MVKGDFENDFADMFRALQDSSRRDPLPDPEENGKFHTHDDGWGIFNVSDGSYLYERHISAVFNNETPPARNGFTMVHSRKTSDDQPAGVLNNHPFHLLKGDAEIYLSHNGWINKNTLPGLDAGKLQKMTDSQALLEYLCRDESEELTTRLENIREKGVDFALANVFLISISHTDDGTGITAQYFTEKGASGHGYEEFDRLYLAGNEEWTGVFSSSLFRSKSFPKHEFKAVVPRGKVFTL